MEKEKEKDIAVHLSPVWRTKADFLIHADLSRVNLPGRWEQLWSRRLQNKHFELCCIPFFAPGLALGDVVEAGPLADKQHVIRSVVKESGRAAARVAFLTEPTEFEVLARQLIDAMRKAKCLFEWYAVGYLAIDIADRKAFQRIDKVLADYGSAGQVKYEFTKQGTFGH